MVKLKKKSKVYISGPISGLSEQEWRLKFSIAAEALEKKGYTPVNPADIGDVLSVSLKLSLKSPAWKAFMLSDLQELADCDAILMLKGWWHSKGAHIEHDFAEAAGIPVFYEQDLIL